MRTTKNDLIESTFAILSVIIIWQINIPVKLKYVAEYLGASEGEILYEIILNGGIPLAVGLSAVLSVWIYRNIIWQYLPGTINRSGWWIYSLVAIKKEEYIPVVGYFYVKQLSTEIYVPEGRSFYVKENKLIHRGDWSSEALWIKGDIIRMVFSMKAGVNLIEPTPLNYDGFVELQEKSVQPIYGLTVWSGNFHDLGDRSGIYGPMYAEYIKNKVKTADGIFKILENCYQEIVNRAYNHMGIIKNFDIT